MFKKDRFSPFFKSNLFFIILFSFISLFFSFLKISKGYTFEWDQSDDATKVLSIINQKKPLLIGPRVSNENGFFVGPYHYYFLLPFYLATKGDPIAGLYAVTFVNLVTTLFSFFLYRRISNQKVAILSTLLLIPILEVTCWNVMYAPLISIVSFYLCYQVISKGLSFPLVMLYSAFISTIHLVPVSLLPVIIFSFIISNNRPKTKEYFLAVFLFILPFLPLIIFDLRHDFLNSNKLITMLLNKDRNDPYFPFLWLRSFWRSLSLYHVFPLLVERIFLLIILLLSPFMIKTWRNKFLILAWIFVPLLLLSRYKGAISEYYYSMLTFIFPFFFSFLFLSKIKNGKKVITLTFLFLLLSAFTIYKSNRVAVDLSDKKAIVNYLVTQKQDQPFNLSYETGVGYDFGFDYLFAYYGNSPQSKEQAHLYTLFTDNQPPAPGTNVVFKRRIYSLVRR